MPYLSAVENVQLPMALYGGDCVNQEKEARHLLERFGLGERLEHKPAELSAGQQQRVALARALISQPTVLLLDEPLGSLDYNLRQTMMVELKKIQHPIWQLRDG